MASETAEHVVVDSAAFIKNAQLQDIAKHVYTVQDVVREIRDYETKKRLSVIPYEIIFREPSPDSIRFVTQFSKKTGDYPSLSAVDIRVMALTHQLTKEHVGLDHIKQEPEMKATWSSSKTPLIKATDMVGWYLPPKSISENQSEAGSGVAEEMDEDGGQEDDIILERIEQSEPETDEKLEEDATNQPIDNAIFGDKEKDDFVCRQLSTDDTGCEETLDKEDDSMEMVSSDVEDVEDCEKEEEVAEKSDKDEDSGNEDGDGSGDEDEDEDGSGDEGWITPQNIKRIKAKLSGGGETLQNVTVGCITTDFAMQNVLVQMGIPVISINGMLIKQTKTYVLKCSGCFKVTPIMTKQFCPHCGNRTLMKVTVTLDEGGEQHYHMSRRKAENKRGLKYSLPMPKGGKHACNPYVVEDQPFPLNKPSRKALQKTNAFDPDYAAKFTPFAIHDTTSRAAQLGLNNYGVHSGHRKNPNENRRTRKK